MSELSKLFGVEHKQPPIETHVVTEDAPHVELGWTSNQVRERYVQYHVNDVPIILTSDNPLLDDDVRDSARSTDQHKASSIRFEGVSRWGILSSLYVTFNEQGLAMEIAWYMEVLSRHSFSAIEAELKQKFGKAEKVVEANEVWWTWVGQEYSVILDGTIGAIDVANAYLQITFEGYRVVGE
jgi:hypothetical protein